MTGLERILPDGSLLEFVDRENYRAYLLTPPDGKRRRLVSVTSVLGVLAKPALLRWSEAEGIKGTIEAGRQGHVDPGTDPEQAVLTVRSLGLGADGARDRAATRGLNTHAILEEWMRSGSPPNPADFPAEHGGYIQGLARALLTLNPEPIHIEQMVADPEMGVAGRYDLRAMIEGRECLCDLKTSRTGMPFPEGHAQLVAYDLLAQACGEPPAERLVMIGVGEDGSFTADECCATPDHWRAVLACYQAVKEFRRPVEAMRRARAKAAKEALAA